MEAAIIGIIFGTYIPECPRQININLFSRLSALGCWLRGCAVELKSSPQQIGNHPLKGINGFGFASPVSGDEIGTHIDLFGPFILSHLAAPCAKD